MKSLTMVSQRQRGWLSKRRPLTSDKSTSLWLARGSLHGFNEDILAVAFYMHMHGTAARFVIGGYPGREKYVIHIDIA